MVSSTTAAKMRSSNEQPEVCLAAAVADLRDMGIMFPEFAPDGGSDDCARCVRARDTRAPKDLGPNLPNDESEAEKQDRLARDIEAFFDNPEAMTMPALGEDGEMPSAQSMDDTSASLDGTNVDHDIDQTLREASRKELESINESMWAAVDGEQSELLNDIDRLCGLPGDDDGDFVMINIDEAGIGLLEIDKA